MQVAICAWLPRLWLRDLCNDRVICSNTPWDQTLYCSKLYGHERFRDLSMIALCTLICLGIGLYTMHEPALTCTSMQESGKPWKHTYFNLFWNQTSSHTSTHYIDLYGHEKVLILSDPNWRTVSDK